MPNEDQMVQAKRTSCATSVRKDRRRGAPMIFGSARAVHTASPSRRSRFRVSPIVLTRQSTSSTLQFTRAENGGLTSLLSAFGCLLIVHVQKLTENGCEQ
jgi:hypothetical protein